MITSEQVMQIIKDYFKKFRRELDLSTLESQMVSTVLTSSFEAVELTMELEDGLNVQEEIIDLEEFAAKFGLISFAELAEEVAQRLNAHASHVEDQPLIENVKMIEHSQS